MKTPCRRLSACGRCIACGKVNEATRQVCQGVNQETGRPRAHLRVIAGVVGGEFKGNDWTCPRCEHHVYFRMWARVCDCRQCGSERSELQQVYGHCKMVKECLKGFVFAAEGRRK